MRSIAPLPLALSLQVAILLGLTGLPAAPAAQDLTCDACHESSTGSSVHADLPCAACHSNVGELPHAEGVLGQLGGGEICAQCHDDVAGVVAESVHGGMLECGACHGPPHETLPVKDLASPVSPAKQIQVCSGCHDDADLVDGYLGSVHGKALLVSGLIGAPSCSDCHGSHGIFPKTDPHSKVSRSQVPESCGTCHVYILDAWRKGSAHGRAWGDGRDDGPVCTSCHSSHEVMSPRSGPERLASPDNCGQCHARHLETYRHSFHGQVTDLGYFTAATCSDCHTPHTNLPASDPESSVHPDNLGATCRKCHAEANAAFLSFDPHIDPRDPADNPVVYYTWLFMTTLLISVFVFFGVHDLLSVQRSVVALARGELKDVRTTEGPWIRRFKPVHVWTHVVVVVSFLLLAATGLPLKFHSTEWAQSLSGLMGGVEVTRFLHRLAAVVTFGYAVVHLVYLARRLIVDRDYGLLYGWRSMVPWPKDLWDFLANVRYFLYLGPRPAMDRWNYLEKFDYFAVFWGILIIGISGLALWFPGLVTAFLPGWALNVAVVIHSDEALLATGFIFAFHFIHTHLRPESFPMDTVVFTGRLPLARFREEKPAEYRRLVETGELESYLAPAPTASELRAARVFGTGALAVGVVLLVGIVWSLLA